MRVCKGVLWCFARFCVLFLLFGLVVVCRVAFINVCERPNDCHCLLVVVFVLLDACLISVVVAWLQMWLFCCDDCPCGVC